MSRLSTPCIALILALCLAVSGCSALQSVGAALGTGGPQVDATAQVGAENNQERNNSIADLRRVEDRSDSRRVERTEDRRVESRVEEGATQTVTQTETRTEVSTDARSENRGTGLQSRDWTSDVINVQQIPDKVMFWLLGLLALGWILPSPADILRGIGKGILFFRDLFTGRI